MHDTPDGAETPSDDATATNSTERKAFDGRTESDLKRLSRTLDKPIVAGGWLFEDGDKHPWPDTGTESGADGETA